MKFSKEAKIKDHNIEIWDKVKNRLRKELGETLYRSWLKPLKLKKINKNTIILSAETSLVRDRVERQYTDRIVSIWASEKPGINDIKVSLENDKIVENQFNPKDKNKNIIQNKYQSDKFAKNDDILLSNLDKRLTFENFVVGSPNELAFAAAKRVAEADFVPFNPLFLYGGVGLGKTHLMNAIAWVIQQKNPNRKVVYISAEKFMYQFIKALRSKDVMNFKQEFRSVDVLMIDDVQFISGKEHTQEEFFHTFNALLDRNNQMILTCDKYPKEIDGLEERLKSRLGWGLPVVIDPPELETRAAVLLSKASSMGVSLPNDCAIYIAQRIRSNIRELEGALKRVVANARFTNQDIDLALVKEALKDLFVISAKMVSVENIQKTVAEYYNIKLSDLLSKRRSRSITRPRQMAMALTKELTNHSLPEIGESFNGRDHTTVLHACKKIAELRKENPSHEEDYRNLNRALTN